MKRFGNIYSKVYDMNNLIQAERRARRGKGNQPGVRSFDRNREENLLLLQHMLKNKTYRTSQYTNLNSRFRQL